MKNIKFHLPGGLRMRGGIFYFLLVLLILEGIRFYWAESDSDFPVITFLADSEMQCWVDSCMHAPQKRERVWANNPNYLSEEQAYILGLSVSSYRKIEQFRASGKYIESLDAFKKVTGLSDSLAEGLKSRLKFPNSINRFKSQKKKTGKVICLNAATSEELQRVRGIGSVLSVRIVKFREALGGFLTPEQLRDVYGVSPEVADRVAALFPVLEIPNVKRINLNDASAFELSKLAYLSFDMAKKLVDFRDLNGDFKTVDQIGDVLDLPNDKIDRIALYLAL